MYKNFQRMSEKQIKDDINFIMSIVYDSVFVCTQSWPKSPEEGMVVHNLQLQFHGGTGN